MIEFMSIGIKIEAVPLADLESINLRGTFDFPDRTH
jgi:hypothetical protein